MIFLNLTNGLEALERIKIENYHFVEIQSTHLEQKQLNLIIRGLGADFLMNLAIGKEIIIYDYSAHSKSPRALWQGIPFIKFACEKVWFGTVLTPPIVKSHNCEKLFNEWFSLLDKKTIGLLKRYRKYAALNKDKKLNIKTISDQTIHDGNNEYFVELLKEKGNISD